MKSNFVAGGREVWRLPGKPVDLENEGKSWWKLEDWKGALDFCIQGGLVEQAFVDAIEERIWEEINSKSLKQSKSKQGSNAHVKRKFDPADLRGSSERNICSIEKDDDDIDGDVVRNSYGGNRDLAMECSFSYGGRRRMEKKNIGSVRDDKYRHGETYDISLSEVMERKNQRIRSAQYL